MSSDSCPGCGGPSFGLAFCTACGRRLDAGTVEVHHQRRRLEPGWITAAVLAIVVVLGVGVGVGVGRPDVPPPQPTPTIPAPTVVVRSTAEVPDTPDPSAALDQVVAQDEVTVSSLTGSWVPQVSSKQVGTVADGITYGEADILASYQRLHAAYSDAVLVRSERFATFKSPGYWVTVIAEPSSSAAGANAWCDAKGLSANDCFAKRLDTVSDGRPTTVMR